MRLELYVSYHGLCMLFIQYIPFSKDGFYYAFLILEIPPWLHIYVPIRTGFSLASEVSLFKLPL